MEGTTGRYRPRSESPVNSVEGQNLNDFEVKIAPEETETNGVPVSNGKQHVGAGEDAPENADER